MIRERDTQADRMSRSKLLMYIHKSGLTYCTYLYEKMDSNSLYHTVEDLPILHSITHYTRKCI